MSEKKKRFSGKRSGSFRSQSGKKTDENDKSKKRSFRKKETKTQREEKEIYSLTSKYAECKLDTSIPFEKMPLSNATKTGLKESDFTYPTEIQCESLPLALQGRDILGAAKTGSGKTLAFLIPILEKLFVAKWSRQDGLGALVITPTRELAFQIFEQLRKIGKEHDFSAGLVIGGKDLHYESKRMATCNIVICTPGRLLQHMDENPQFDAGSLQMLVLDEADRILDMGFAEQVNAILSNLPTERQTLLFSATQTRSVKDLARLSLETPVFVSVHEHATKATPDELSEHYVICNVEDKVNMLWSFIKNHKRKKVLVFVQSCKQAKYYCALLKRLRVPTPVTALYGTLKQLRRMDIYSEFVKMESGVLIATDIASRGLDFPTVDWVLQLDCPEDWKAYNHRVGRTARNKTAGNALLVLTPNEEEPMLKQLRIHKFSLEKLEVDPKKIVSVQRKLEAHLASDKELKEESQRAFQSYLKSVFLMRDKGVFDVTRIDTTAFANSLGLVVPPRVRFLQKHLNKTQKKSGANDEESAESDKKDEISSALQMSDSDDDDGDDMLKVKRINHDLSDDELEVDIVNANLTTLGKIKITTKASIAKKLLKKNISANRKVKFGEDGDILEDSSVHKLSKEGQKYERDDSNDNGIDFSKAKKILKAEDVFDKTKEKSRIKELHREKKRKEKEAKNARRKQTQTDNSGDESDGSSDEGPDLSWLPDPDKIYGKEEKDCSEPEDEPKRKKKRVVEEEVEDLVESSDQLREDELLAMKLLQS